MVSVTEVDTVALAGPDLVTEIVGDKGGGENETDNSEESRLTPVKWSGLVKDSRTLLRGTGHDVQWVAVQLGRRNRKFLEAEPLHGWVTRSLELGT